MLLITSLLWLLSSRQQININTADIAAAAAHNDNEDDCLFLLLLILLRYQWENRGGGSSRKFIITSELHSRVNRAASVTCFIIPFSIHLCYWCRFAEWLYQWRRTRFYIHLYTYVYKVVAAAGIWIFENIVECEVTCCSCFEEKAAACLFADSLTRVHIGGAAEI